MKELFESWKQFLEEVKKEEISIMGVNSEDGIQEWEEEEYEENEDYISVVDQAYSITKIRPSRANDLSFVAVDLNDNNKVYGAIYSGVSGGVSDGVYSFDLEVHPDAQGMGIASELIDAAMENYEQYKEYYENLKMEVHVINKFLVNHLIKKGFEIAEESKGEWLMRYKEVEE
jgi:ribosomal protein S18 acetylase RimI-like enzyme